VTVIQVCVMWNNAQNSDFVSCEIMPKPAILLFWYVSSVLFTLNKNHDRQKNLAVKESLVR